MGLQQAGGHADRGHKYESSLDHFDVTRSDEDFIKLRRCLALSICLLSTQIEKFLKQRPAAVGSSVAPAVTS